MIVWLASYPRSGNTLFRMALKHVYGLETYSAYEDPDITGMGAAPTVGHAGRAKIKRLSRSRKTYLVKTHTRVPDDRAAIYIVRDGRDACVSHAHYIRAGLLLSPQERANRLPPSFEDKLRHIILGGSTYGGWSQHVNVWTDPARRAPLHLVRYEELIASPEAVVGRAIEAVEAATGRTAGRETAAGSLPSFEELNRKWPDFFRKGTTGAWRDDMPPELHELFWEHHGSAMQALGYER